MARRRRVGFSRQHLELDEIGRHHADVEASIRSYFDFGNVRSVVRFAGYTSQEIRWEMNSLLEEQDRAASMSLLAALAGAPAIPRSGIAKRPRQRSPLAASRAAMYSSRRSTGMMAHGQRSPPASRSSGTGRCARCRPDRDGRGRTGSARARHERKAPAHRAEGRRTPASRHGPRTDSAARASNAGCRRGCYGIRQGRPGAQDPRPRWGRTSPGTRSGGLPRRPFRGSRLRPPGGRCRARPWYACQ